MADAEPAAVIDAVQRLWPHLNAVDKARVSTLVFEEKDRQARVAQQTSSASSAAAFDTTPQAVAFGDSPAAAKPAAAPAGRPTPVGTVGKVLPRPVAVAPVPAAPALEAKVPELVARATAVCVEVGTPGEGKRFVNIIVRGDGSVGWIRFEGVVSATERACTELALKKQQFPKHEGDLTLARVELPRL